MLELNMSHFEENPHAKPRMESVFGVNDAVFFVNEERVLCTDKITAVLAGKLIDNVEIVCWCYVLESSQLRFVDFGQKLPLFFTAAGAKEDAINELENLKIELTEQCDQIEEDVDKIYSATAVLAGY